ncbi:hypothetical protein IFM89_032279 [Coptis chinensis]|uniref:NAB domain-containing protein n=1 Tax=Coptis chinensis TaxID=261450 RepID=A0A835H0F7_9MAGN|nr:hypothetical protein IFM89_032279 [Coptis chinensis]
MYYKKRPELMKLVEEFYRAYRALAERYDHATGALRQAHQTMAEAFPNQVPFVLPDDSPSSATETEPHTPEMTRPVRASLEEVAKVSNNIISRMMLGFRCSGEDEWGKGIRSVVREATEIIATFNLSDFIWFL